MCHFGVLSRRLDLRDFGSLIPSSAPSVSSVSGDTESHDPAISTEAPHQHWQERGAKVTEGSEAEEEWESGQESRRLGELVYDLWGFVGGAIDVPDHLPLCMQDRQLSADEGELRLTNLIQ